MSENPVKTGTGKRKNKKRGTNKGGLKPEKNATEENAAILQSSQNNSPVTTVEDGNVLNACAAPGCLSANASVAETPIDVLAPGVNVIKVKGRTEKHKNRTVSDEKEKISNKDKKPSVHAKNSVSQVINNEKPHEGPHTLASIPVVMVDTRKKSEQEVVISKQVHEQAPNKDESVPPKSKAELRAERRALQDAQRAAKAKSGKMAVGVPTPASGTLMLTKIANQVELKKIKEDQIKKVTVKAPSQLAPKLTSLKQSKLFSHLPRYERNISVIQASKEGIHPAVIQLGLQYGEGVICGSNARCVALIYALLEVIHDFKMPESKEFSDALLSIHIDPSMIFLEKCRPISVGMKNVSKKLREEILNLPKHLSEDESKKRLEEMLRSFLQDDIMKAHVAIVNLAKEKIAGNDVILTYGCSYLVKRVLEEAHQKAKFRVIVVDARPKLEGKSMFDYLVQQGIHCTYVLINAVSYAMQEATKVFLGAHALLANGYVMSRVGSSQVALVAKAYNKPVLVCCETYKFCELVETDSFVFNELGNPEDLVETLCQTNPLAGWKDMKSLNILNLYYDVTPPDLVTVVINDVHLVPCTSVPVLLRVKPTKKMKHIF